LNACHGALRHGARNSTSSGDYCRCAPLFFLHPPPRFTCALYLTHASRGALAVSLACASGSSGGGLWGVGHEKAGGEPF
jgi:hypothetical protein